MDESMQEYKQRYAGMETYELVDLINLSSLTEPAKQALKQELDSRKNDPDTQVEPYNKNMKKGNGWWPNVNDSKGLKDAIHAGAGVALWLTISYIFGTGYLLYTDESLFTGSVTNEEQIGILITNVIAIFLSLFLAWRIWKKAGYISAIVLLLWVMSEVGYKFVLAPGTGIIIGIIMLLFATHGVRGTIKNRFGGGNY